MSCPLKRDREQGGHIANDPNCKLSKTGLECLNFLDNILQMLQDFWIICKIYIANNPNLFPNICNQDLFKNYFCKKSKLQMFPNKFGSFAIQIWQMIQKFWSICNMLSKIFEKVYNAPKIFRPFAKMTFLQIYQTNFGPFGIWTIGKGPYEATSYSDRPKGWNWG